MEILQESANITKKTFFNHVFSASDESTAELLNVVQYASMGVFPVVILNKLIQRYVPDANPENSSLELLVEVFAQIVIMFCGVVLIHRMISYVPTYSGFKYDTLSLTNVVLAFLIIVLSIQTKVGLKVNILFDRALELWNGPSDSETTPQAKNRVRVKAPVSQHSPSQADYLDNTSMQSNMFPPAPAATAVHQSLSSQPDYMMHSGSNMNEMMGSMMGPMAANGVLGGSFGAAF
jgi:hypothetical protein